MELNDLVNLSSLFQFSPTHCFCICPVGESALGGSQVETEDKKTESCFFFFLYKGLSSKEVAS